VLWGRRGGAPAGSAGVQRVAIASDNTAFNVNATVTQSTASNLNAQVVGTVAHDGVDAGNPVKIGAKAISSQSGLTLVAANDRTDLYADLDGTIISRGIALGDLKSDAVSNTDGNSTASTVFTAVASTKNYITGIVVYRTDAGTTTQYIDFRDGTAGSVLWRLPLPPNGGAVLPVSNIPWFKTTANTALAYDVSSALTTVYISVSGFQSKL